MNVWLICITEGTDACSVYKKDTETEALQYVGAVVIGQHAGTAITKIYVVDTLLGKITELEPVLAGLALTFREKEAIT